jgi:hypothetical protein
VNPSELAGLIASFVLTLMVFSYLLGENPLSRPLYRTALHVFIGAAAGYALAVVAQTVLWPRLGRPLLTGEFLDPPFYPVAPLLLGLALLLKVFQSGLGRLGNLPAAFVVGAGAAVAVGGAVTGTLLPQVAAGAAAGAYPLGDLGGLLADPGAQLERLVSAAVFFIGTLATLLYFFYLAPGAQALGAAGPGATAPARHPIMAGVAIVGQFFINVAYGTLYAGAVAASLALLTERMAFLWTAFNSLISLR